MNKQQKIIALCASHIDSFERLSNLKQMICEWNSQEVKIPLFIGISVDDPFFISAFDYFDEAYVIYPTICFFISSEKKSQFQHYKQVYEKIKDIYSTENPYVVFTDDDDLWHPQRITHYAAALKETKTDVLRIPIYGELSEGKIISTNYQGTSGNYIEYVCKFRLFEQFLMTVSDFLLDHYLCDLCFVKFLRTNKNLVTKIDIPKDIWMYYYRGSEVSNKKNIKRVSYYLDYFTLDEILKNKIGIVKHFINDYSTFLLMYPKRTVKEKTKEKIIEGFLFFNRDYLKLNYSFFIHLYNHLSINKYFQNFIDSPEVI